jgi:hypothetical protein
MKLDIFVTINTHIGVLGRVVNKVFATSWEVSGSRPCGMNKYSIYVILHSIQSPRGFSTCNRNEYQKEEINVSGE